MNNSSKKEVVLVIPGSWNYEYLNRLHQLNQDNSVMYIYLFLDKSMYTHFINIPGNDKAPYYTLYQEPDGLPAGELTQEDLDIFKGVGFGELILGEIQHFYFGVVPQNEAYFKQKYYQQSIVYVLNYLKYIHKAYNIDIVLYEGYNSHVSKVIYHYFNSLDIMCIYPFSVVFPGRAFMVDGRYAFSRLFYDAYIDKKNKKKTEFHPAVTKLMERVRGNKSIYGNFEELVIRKEKSGTINWLSVPVKALRSVKKMLVNDRKSYSLIDFLQYRQTEKSRVQAILNSRRNNRWYDSQAVQKAEKGHGVYFMHFQPEATTHGIAPYFTDEISNIKMIAKAMPINMNLYVKDHPNDSYSRGENYFHELTYYPNIKFLSKVANPIEVIRDAAIVFTVSGSIMVEAAILGKPVIAFSKLTHTLLPNVKCMGETEQLPVLIDELLDGNFINYLSSEASNNKVATYLETIYESSFIYEGVTEEEKNATVRNYAAATQAYLHRYGNNVAGS